MFPVRLTVMHTQFVFQYCLEQLKLRAGYSGSVLEVLYTRQVSVFKLEAGLAVRLVGRIAPLWDGELRGPLITPSLSSCCMDSMTVLITNYIERNLINFDRSVQRE